MVLSKSASPSVATVPTAPPPALATSTSILPNFSAVSLNTRSRSARLVTSALRAMKSAPSCATELASVSGLRPTIAPLAPSFLNSWAMPNPMPLLPPAEDFKKEYKREMRAIQDAMDVLSGKWKIAIITSICCYRIRRFSDILTDVEGISNRMLSKELKELETHQLITRTVLDTQPIT
nr:hypothetical protein [Tanacetum cinerariifolium]